MPDPTIEVFYSDYLKSLEQGVAGIFAGAGLSQASGYVNWHDLLRDIAKELNLDVDAESDLIAVAQYHVNTHGGRDRLNKLLIEEFTKDATITENHRLIANLPIHVIWTTNYDRLIEQAFEAAQKRVDVKATKENLATTLPRRDVTLYKMHGDISQPHTAVLTKEDYETYAEERGIFSDMLKGDLISKTFLFIGFSFTDPNIDYLLSRIRSLLGQNQREHYCLMRRVPRRKGTGRAKAQYEYAKTKFDLRLADLKRYHIRPLLVDDYSEITAILAELGRRCHRRDIFVSGSADDYEPMGRERIEGLARTIGRDIIRRGYNLVSGFGLGIGGAVAIGALEEAYARTDVRTNERVCLRPFPRRAPAGMSREAFNTKYREDMISGAGFVIFLAGNKREASTGGTVAATGVLEEFEIAKRLGKHPIPVGATNHAALQIWKEVNNSLDHFYPQGGVRGHFKVLGDARKTDREIVDAIFAVVKRYGGK